MKGLQYIKNPVRKYGLKNSLFFKVSIGLLLINCFAYFHIAAQVKNTTTVYISPGAIVYCKSDFINGTAASYQNNGNFFITGDFSNNQTTVMAPGSGTTSFVGTSPQAINGPQPFFFNNLTVNNTQNVKMVNNVTISGAFKPQAGSLIIQTNQLLLNGTIDNSVGNIGTLTGSNTSVLNVGGTGNLLGTITFAPGTGILNNCIINRTSSGFAALGSDLNIITSLTLTNGAFAINGNALTLSGVISSTNGTLSGSSTSKLVVAGTGGGNVGTLNFTAGAQTLNSFTMNRTGGSNARALMGTNISADNFVLTNGMLVTANNLVTWNNNGGTITSPNTPWAANNSSYNNSYIATCDASGIPITPSTPFDGSKGFRINKIGNTNVYFPVGADFKSANRMMLNNSGTTDNFTVVVGYGDVVNTPLPRVNRIWYVNAASGAGIKANMQLFFTKQNASNYGISQDEVETGFNYNDIHLIQKNYSQQFVNNASGADVTSFINNVSYPLGTEIYGTYTRGVSTGLGGSTNGINGFTRFGVVNSSGIILPLTIINLKAYRQNDGINVAWSSVDEINIDHYEIQRAANGTSFSFAGRVAALKNGQPSINYSFTDAQPLSGNNFYRILAVDNNGRNIISNIVLVRSGNIISGIAVYPNPVTGSVATLQFSDVKAGTYTAVLYSTTGQKLWQTTVQHPGGYAAYSMLFPASLAKGAYHLEIIGEATKDNKILLIQ